MRLSPELDEEHEAVIAEIHAAFDGVTREGGVSWGETILNDAYGDWSNSPIPPPEYEDSRWQDLIENRDWMPRDVDSVFSYLDNVGFRYYLPAAMVRSAMSGEDAGVQFHLDLSDRVEPRSRAYALEQWSALDDRQARCVARFLRYMVVLERRWDEGADFEYWRTAYESHWASLPSPIGES